ncbi:hypothetical protein ACHAQJ_006147 [Trichoderma viride]
MSQASRIALAATSTFTGGMIVWVHFRQKAEKYAMHQGVVLDMERQRVKRERELDFDMQRQLEEEYKREQNVHSSLEPASQSSAPPK